jgi:hypothetical protein
LGYLLLILQFFCPNNLQNNNEQIDNFIFWALPCGASCSRLRCRYGASTSLSRLPLPSLTRFAAHYEPPPQVDVPRLTRNPSAKKDPARMARVDPGIDALDMEVEA